MHTPCNWIDSREPLTDAQRATLWTMLEGAALFHDSFAETLTRAVDAGYARDFAEAIHAGEGPVAEQLEAWCDEYADGEV